MPQEFCPIQSPTTFAAQLDILHNVKSVAVVGMSPNPARISQEVGLFLQGKGYRVIPIHPTASEIGGLKAYPTLTAALAAGESIDLVDLFVSGSRVLDVVKEAIGLNLRRIWFQPGSEWPVAQELAYSAGLVVVDHACTMAVLRRAEQSE